MLTGATRITVELAVAILTLLFHYHSSRTSPATHQCNSKVGCAVPIEAHMNGSSTERSMEYTFPFSSITEETTEQGTTATEPASSNVESADNVIVIAENIEDVYTELVSKMILDVSHDLFKVISNLEKKSYSRGLEVLDLLAMANMPDAISTASVFDKEEDDNTIKGYVDVLNRNLAAFDLEIEAVIGDGDCAFRSLAKQIARLSGENGSFKEHLKSLNLPKTEDEDTFQLRQLFADKIAEGDDELLAFLPIENSDGDIEARVN